MSCTFTISDVLKPNVDINDINCQYWDEHSPKDYESLLWNIQTVDIVNSVEFSDDQKKILSIFIKSLNNNKNRESEKIIISASNRLNYDLYYKVVSELINLDFVIEFYTSTKDTIIISIDDLSVEQIVELHDIIKIATGLYFLKNIKCKCKQHNIDFSKTSITYCDGLITVKCDQSQHKTYLSMYVKPNSNKPEDVFAVFD